MIILPTLALPRIILAGVLARVAGSDNTELSVVVPLGGGWPRVTNAGPVLGELSSTITLLHHNTYLVGQ